MTFDSPASLRVSAVFAFWTVSLAIIISLGMALLLNQRFKGHTFFRGLFYLPAAVSGVAMTFVWAAMFEKDYGMFNQILRIFDFDRIGWLTSITWALPSFIIMRLYGVGHYMVIMRPACRAYRMIFTRPPGSTAPAVWPSSAISPCRSCRQRSSFSWWSA